jgi:hypothetical protein
MHATARADLVTAMQNGYRGGAYHGRHAPEMFVVSKAEAAVRTFAQCGEFAAAVELRGCSPASRTLSRRRQSPTGGR